MNSTRLLSLPLVALALSATALTAVPAHAARLTIPVQCEVGTETVLPWDDVSYDLRGTCGVVRVPADAVTTPSIRSLLVSGTGTTVSAAGLVERAVLLGSGTSLTADTVNALRMRGTDTVRARKAYRTRITGADNSLSLTRADRLVLTGDRNTVTVARGRTTLRDRGTDNVLDLRPRRR